METLLEYLTFVKGIGYLLVVAFLLAFLTFWQLTHTKEKDFVKVVPVVVVIWLAFGAASLFSLPAESAVAAPSPEAEVTESPFPEYYSNGSPATVTSHSAEKWLGVNSSEYLTVSYGSVVNFHQVMGTKLGCKDCHHNSGDEIHACKDCHSAPFNPANLSKPGIKGAIHTRCMYCHREVFGGPQGCRLCHTRDVPASGVAPARPHELTWEDCTRCHKDGIPRGLAIKIVYHDFCIKCHTKGIEGAAKLPVDHAGRTGDTCKGCHRPVTEENT